MLWFIFQLLFYFILETDFCFIVLTNKNRKTWKLFNLPLLPLLMSRHIWAFIFFSFLFALVRFRCLIFVHPLSPLPSPRLSLHIFCYVQFVEMQKHEKIETFVLVHSFLLTSPPIQHFNQLLSPSECANMCQFENTTTQISDDTKHDTFFILVVINRIQHIFR